MPSSWVTFVGAGTGERDPFTVTTPDRLGLRVATNLQVFALNYVIIALGVGCLRVLLSPSLLFMSGATMATWWAYQMRHYEKLRMQQLHFFRAATMITFLVMCILGPTVRPISQNPTLLARGRN